ncbi:hypothetical protein SCOR_33885 [Sulfidibacter corallicola]|uniref:Uncharacterized protein n=1 Tax=Sulfidibacter corallicola TaxID=2818388 RepID=A0A8A4TJV0_SULCO|nr:hypothetical protein [Sulfidibacter corallicola]QTD49474.1 hypothetical protein J3U87_28140 [Sulfidibacter corallicola]
MENHETFITYINRNHSIDFWSDIGIDHAITLAKQLSKSDWDFICKTWKSETNLVQSRIAELISEISFWNDELFNMLLEMLRSDNREVSEASLDTLNSIVQTSPNKLDYKKIDKALQNIKERDIIFNTILRSLKKNTQ